MAPVVKNPPANAGDIRDMGSIPGLGRSPGGGHGNPLQYSCLDNPMDGGVWWATKCQTGLEWLSTHHMILQKGYSLVTANRWKPVLRKKKKIFCNNTKAISEQSGTRHNKEKNWNGYVYCLQVLCRLSHKRGINFSWIALRIRIRRIWHIFSAKYKKLFLPVRAV